VVRAARADLQAALGAGLGRGHASLIRSQRALSASEMFGRRGFRSGVAYFSRNTGSIGRSPPGDADHACCMGGRVSTITAIARSKAAILRLARSRWSANVSHMATSSAFLTGTPRRGASAADCTAGRSARP
jgi:hypothetical protein